MFALAFVIFDVETVFLYPWAVAFNQLGLLAFIEALIFISILIFRSCICLAQRSFRMVMKAENVGLDFSIEDQKQRLINPIEESRVTQDLSNNVVFDYS